MGRVFWGRPSWARFLARGSELSCFCTDVSESAWRGRLAPRSMGPKRQPGDHGADPEAPPGPLGRPQTPACDPRTLPCKPLLSPPVKNGESHSREGLASLILDAQRPAERGRLRKVQTVPRLLPEGPEASALCLPLPSVKKQLPTSDFFSPDPRKAFPPRKNGLSSFKAQPQSRLWPEWEPEPQREGARGVGHSGDGAAGVPGQGAVEEHHPPCSEDPGDAGGDRETLGLSEQIPDGAGEPGSAALEQVGEGCSAWPVAHGSWLARVSQAWHCLLLNSEGQGTLRTVLWELQVCLASPWAL